MFEWAYKNNEGIKYFYVSNNDVTTSADAYKTVLIVKYHCGTWSHHSFFSMSEGKLQMRQLSSDPDSLCSIVSIGDHAAKPSTSSDVQTMTDPNEYQPGQYIACTYDNEWYIGIIMGHSEEQNDIRFMTRAKNSNALSWSEDIRNECWVPFQDIIYIVSVPEMQGRGRRQYRLTNEDMKNIQGKLPAFIE